MHIKTLTIQGFKSYRDQINLEPFSPRHNVVLGRNGSGKSNFFAAIRFVLSDAYTSMSREERQLLLHEGAGVTSTMSAYVEIVFDNSDGRFPTGKDEVIIRRTIGLKKDEYSLDKKSSSKAEVMTLLESAGFSKSNPYYIVPQGRITSLTNAKDHERLALLKEVAGTRVYETRRAESEKIIEETESKQSKIDELLAYIEERLQELEEEKEELREFQQNDKERRCLEYALYQRELLDVSTALEEIEEEREREGLESKETRRAHAEREQKIQFVEAEIAEKRQQQSLLSLNRREMDNEMQDLIRSKTEVECLVADLRSADDSNDGTAEQLQNQLQDISQRISEKEVELMEIEPEWASERQQEMDEKRKFDDINSRLQALYAKQGRLAQFSSRAERDAFLRREINSLSTFRENQSSTLNNLQLELDRTISKQQELTHREEELQARLHERKERLGQLDQEISSFRQQHADLSERRKEFWKEDSRLESIVSHARSELGSAERTLASMMDKDTGMGLRAVDRIAERNRLSGVYGPLYRLFTVKSKVYNTAVELTAGASLFHVVVDNDETASRVLEEMMKEKTGRVTFMPLNRLKPKVPVFPQTQETQPLIDQLAFDPKYTKAFRQVFGKTCVCKDLTVAAKCARSHDLNAITIEGDKVDRKGALTGGYHDIRRSRIDGINAYMSWSVKLEEETKKSHEVKGRIGQLEQEITRLSGKLQVATTQRMQLQDVREPLGKELLALKKEWEATADRRSRLEKEVADLNTELRSLATKVGSCEQELASPMTDRLSLEERTLLKELSNQVDQCKRTLVELSRRVSEIGSKKEMIEIELDEDLRRRRDDLRATLETLESSSQQSTSPSSLAARSRELKSLESSMSRLSKAIKDAENELETLTAETQQTTATLESLQRQQAEHARGFARQQKMTERYLAKRQMLTARKDECSRNIRDLGVLPEEAFEKYTKDKVKVEKLVKKLHSVNDTLKKFGHVNKKAFEQYSNFTKQREELRRRRQDLEKSAKSIHGLIATLDQRKDEAIERTFKQVSKYFEEVFEKLAPAGRGRLIMQRSIDQTGPDLELADEAGGSVDRYTGVAIKVSFNSKDDEGLRIQQLSGGQKSLVALATVFAIQKCDPAPFYLFDEIDANLDAQYRSAVAAMIHELSDTAQFITTTFRPEMLETADKFYGVLFNNQKVSSIQSITQQDAHNFVEQEALIQ